MNFDEHIRRVRELRRYNYAPHLPASVVIADRDWLAYVQAMTTTLPDVDVAYPVEEDVLWSWPGGVLIVFDEPLEVQHTITSKSTGWTMAMMPTIAHDESQVAVALCIARKQPLPTNVVTDDDGNIAVGEATFDAYPTMWIGEDMNDIVQGAWLPGVSMRPAGDHISGSTRLLVSMITAFGHRLTRHAHPTGDRGARRRVEREVPGLRVLELASGASVTRDTNGSVEWSRRWMVRGHWRLQPHGEGRALRKAIWIDPYVKGPADKPLDVRETVWVQR